MADFCCNLSVVIGRPVSVVIGRPGKVIIKDKFAPGVTSRMEDVTWGRLKQMLMLLFQMSYVQMRIVKNAGTPTKVKVGLLSRASSEAQVGNYNYYASFD